MLNVVFVAIVILLFETYRSFWTVSPYQEGVKQIDGHEPGNFPVFDLLSFLAGTLNMVRQ